jgi:HAE1 family hydrophobic/amphiphilic exporter-1
MKLVRFSLRRPVTLAMALATVLVLGLISLHKLPLAFLPQVEFPFIGVVVPYPGGIPSETERDIARPIEEVLATLGGVREINSESGEDQTFVGVEFDWGRDVNLMRLEVQEKIDQIRGQLPPQVRDIFLFTFNSNDIPIMEGRISAKGRDLSESYELIEQKIIMPLQRIPGVGRVQIDGVNPTEGAIYLRYDKIKEHNVDVGRLFQELGSANIDLSIGRITEGGLRYEVRSVSGLHHIEELEDLPIGSGDLRLGDVAELVYAAPVPPYGRRLNGEFAIAFMVQKASGYNTVEVGRAVERELERINLDPSLQGVSSFAFFNQADQITDSLKGLWKSGIEGSILAIAVLFLFLRRWSLTFVVGLAIPLSLLVTFIYFFMTGMSLNVLTMMGLMLGIGMLVDDAVVVLEAIYQRKIQGAGPVAASFRGTKDVALAITASTLTTIIVFAPVIVTRGDELAVWLGEVGITIAVTKLASLLVSLTVVPALAIVMLRRSKEIHEAGWLRRLRAGYQRTLQWTTFRHPKLTGFAIVPGIILLTAGLMAVTKFKPDLMGEEGIKQERIRISLEFTGAVDKNTSGAHAKRVEEYLDANREALGIRDIYSVFGPDYATISAFFKKDVLSAKVLKKTREKFRKELPVQAGVKYVFGDEEGNDSGAKGFAVTLFGEDTELLTELAREAKRRLGALEGVRDVLSDGDRGHPEIQVAIDPVKAASFGIRPEEISQILGLTYRGTRLSRLSLGSKEIDLTVSLLPEDRESIENLSALTVGAHDGQPIVLGQLADFRFERSPQTIVRTNQKTGVTVRGTYEGEDFDEMLKRVEAVMSEFEMPLGYGWGFGTEIERNRQKQSEVGLNLLLALACVFFVMAALYESLIDPLLIMGCIPLAFLGVFWFMILTATPFNIMAVIGIVILVGVVVSNGIVLIDHINGNQRLGMTMEQAVFRGCDERLRPILMTAGTTILGLVPLAFQTGAHVGDAEYYPMARALIGGMTSGTILTLVFLPTYYRIVHLWLEKVRAIRGGFVQPAISPARIETSSSQFPA